MPPVTACDDMPPLLPGQMRGLMMDRPLLIAPILRFAAEFHGDTPMITRSIEGPIHRTDYATLHARVQQLANALIDLGIKPGDRVATLAWNTWRHIELYYAISGIGAVCHTLNPRLPPDQICYIIRDAEDVALFFDITFAEGARAIAEGAPSVRHFVALSDAAHTDQLRLAPKINVRAYEDVIGNGAPVYDFPEFDENAAASLCYTSGTTGNPKGVLYSHRSLVLHSYTLSANFPIGVDETALPVVPMFHVNAWGVPYAAPMGGASLVMPGRNLDGPSLFKLMDDEAVTSAHGVPTVWMGLIATMRAEGRKPHALRQVLIGGAAVPEAMLDAFESEFGIEVNHAWGMTEMSPIGVINTLKPKLQTLPSDAQAKLKLKQGRGVFGVEMRLVDADGRVLPHDGVAAGQLQVRGFAIMRRYFRSDSDATTDDGWFDTGDIATIDADGYMLITDRSKDVIKSGGEWISSVMLENAAMSHPAIAQAAVIGVPHPNWLERPLLIIVRQGDVDPTLDDVRGFLADKVPRWWLPDAIAFVEALPLGATGKVQKTALRSDFAAYRLPEEAERAVGA